LTFIGEDFLINPTTDGDQSEPSVTALSDGRFVASWSSFEASSGTWDIRGRVFSADGAPAGDDFVVNNITADNESLPSITALANGGFAVAWQLSFGSDFDVHGRIFNPDGSPAADEFVVNAGTISRQQEPAMATLPDGRFVVSWIGEVPTDHTYDILARIFNADGTPVGDAFTVNTRLHSYEYQPSITSLSDGGFVVAWHYSDFGAIEQARVFHADGTPASDEFGFGDASFNAQDARPSVAALNDGGFVVIWERHVTGFGDNQGEIRGQIFHADGTPASSEFAVNTRTIGDQTQSKVTALSDGRIMVSWLSDSEDGATYAIRGRLFNADGSPAAGDDFVVNTTLGVGGSAPSIDALSNGHFVVTWQSFEGDTSSYDIRGIILPADPDVNAPPHAVDDNGKHIAFNTPGVFLAADLLANDTDADHDPLNIVSVSAATHGSVVLDGDGNSVFTAAGNYSGAASFSYSISDGHSTSTANVQFTIDGPAQTLIGGAGDDLLVGSTGNDRIIGNNGADVLAGGDGNDWMSGGRGRDVLHGGHGADTMLGGADDDIYYVDNAHDVVIEGRNGGVDEVRSSISYTLGSYVENLILNGAVNGTGNKFDNHITGSDNANVLSGGIGRDVLEGGRGGDVLTAGRDSDVFAFKAHFGHDVITDFAVTHSYSAIGPDHDVLELDLSIFANATALFAHSLDTAQGVLVTADTGDSVLLEHTTLTQLQAHPEDFHFV
jgi:Ca2+-binding RTX toxin-like protein